MRVSAPLVGHLLPLANALRAAGHDVLPAAGGDAKDGGGLPQRDIAGRLNLVAVCLRETVKHPVLSLGALAAGIPQLVVPGPGDRRFNGELVGRRGAGPAVEARDITCDEPTRLVTDGGLRVAAEEVRAERAAMPEPASLVSALEEL